MPTSPLATRIVEPEDTGWNGANGCRWILVAGPRLRADGPALPSRAVMACGRRCILVGLMFSAACRGAIRSRARPRSSAADGYARLVLKLAEDVASEVTTAGSIVVIRFKQPVDIPVDKLSDAVPDYVGSARRDPDGSAIRLSLARRVTINTMTAGERVFVDFLPDTWTGPPPSLPRRGDPGTRRARARRRARPAPAARR